MHARKNTFPHVGGEPWNKATQIRESKNQLQCHSIEIHSMQIIMQCPHSVKFEVFA